jgi:chemotaxis protein histidine kinase CheA
MDNEMKTFFVDEIKEIRKNMVGAISGLIDSKMEENKNFEQFGQLVDRIYGTAATLGLTEISEYMKAVKDVSYMASASENEAGKKKTVKFLIKYLELSDQICDAIFDEEELTKINHLLNIEKSRAELLNKKEFFSIQKKSCDIE